MQVFVYIGGTATSRTTMLLKLKMLLCLDII